MFQKKLSRKAIGEGYAIARKILATPNPSEAHVKWLDLFLRALERVERPSGVGTVYSAIVSIRFWTLARLRRYIPQDIAIWRTHDSV